MEISASVFFTDILPERRGVYHRVVKNRLFQRENRAEVFSALKAAGVEGIELLLPSFKTVSYADIEEVKVALDAHEMPVLSLHQALRFFSRTKLAEITRLFHIA